MNDNDSFDNVTNDEMSRDFDFAVDFVTSTTKTTTTTEIVVVDFDYFHQMIDH